MTDCISNLIELRESGEDIENPLHRRRVRIPEYSMGISYIIILPRTRTSRYVLPHQRDPNRLSR